MLLVFTGFTNSAKQQCFVSQPKKGLEPHEKDSICIGLPTFRWRGPLWWAKQNWK